MKNEWSNKTAMVVDNGLWPSMAERLAREGGFDRVLYFVPWVSSFPTRHLAQIGKGLTGVERVENFWDAAPEVDIFIFLDVHFGDIQEELKRQGKRVWGPGHGENLELYRWDAKTYLKGVGLPVQKCELVAGLPMLREYLKRHDDLYIKVSSFRGIGETFHHINYKLSEIRLDQLENDLGPLVDVQEFVVEHPVDTFCEVGFDGYCIDGKFPSGEVLYGIEKKDVGYVGAVVPYAKLDDSMKVVNEKLAPAFNAYGYRGFFSSEIRIGKDKKPYLIDLTCRRPCPPGEIYDELFANLPEIMWEGSAGNLVEMKPAAKYAVELILYSEFAANNWLAVEIPDDIRQWVKLFNHTVIEGAHWVVPTDAKLVQVGAVVGLGNTIKEAFDHAVKNAKMVKGDSLDVKLDAIPSLLASVRESVKNGFYFGASEVPETIET